MKNEHMYSNTLKMRCGKTYEEFDFDEAYFQELYALMGISDSDVDLDTFAVDHFNLLFGYLQALQHETRQVSITAENKELEKVRKLARDLAEKLGALHSFGFAGKRLFSEIEAFPPNTEDTETPNIRMLLEDPNMNPFGGIIAFLDQLQIGLERAKIKQPKPSEKLTPNIVDQSFDSANKEQFLRNFANSNIEGDRYENYRKRQAEYSLRKNHALTCFAEIFEEMWFRFSDLPFTEGRYEPDARQSISRTVDAAEHSLRKFGASYPRSLIEKKVREVRERRYTVMS